MKKRSVRVSGHNTSITLEDEFWGELQNISMRLDLSINEMISIIDAQQKSDNLSSAIRLYILKDMKARLSAEGL